jgi:hypothetical protein
MILQVVFGLADFAKPTGARDQNSSFLPRVILEKIN